MVVLPNSPRRPFLRWALILSLPLACGVVAILYFTVPSPNKPEDRNAPASASGAVAVGNPGKELYGNYCTACHGETGDGNGPAARFLYPKPRNFREARFRLVSTVNLMPSDENIFNVITRGMPGSAMVSFGHLSTAERQALVGYVRHLTVTGLVDKQRAGLGANPDPAELAELEQEVVEARKPGEKLPVPELPPPRPESVARGAQLYRSEACANCHGNTGKGDGVQEQPEALKYGENLVVHREAVEATPYLPNVIVSSSPFVRPRDYKIPLDTLDPDLRQVRNVRMPWTEVKKTANPLWQQGFQFFCSTPKSRHSTHSSWSTVDWHWIWSDNFGDPYRADKRAPGVADRQIQMNPQAAADRGIREGDYVYVDANPLDRPYVGWADDKNSFRHKAFRCLVRVKFNPGLPYNFTIMKHTGWIATERSVRAHETRPDGRALSAETGYQASYRYGSHQSITRGWMPPMHQTDSLFHKRTVAMGFVFGFDVDNHAINTVPKETLIKITKTEDGGLGGKGVWEAATRGYGPGNDTPQNQQYLGGGYVKVIGKA